MNEGFFTDIKTAELFFRYCKRFKMNSPKERIMTMRRIVARGKAKYIRARKESVNDKKG